MGSRARAHDEIYRRVRAVATGRNLAPRQLLRLTVRPDPPRLAPLGQHPLGEVEPLLRLGELAPNRADFPLERVQAITLVQHVAAGAGAFPKSLRPQAEAQRQRRVNP